MKRKGGHGKHSHEHGRKGQKRPGHHHRGKHSHEHSKTSQGSSNNSGEQSKNSNENQSDENQSHENQSKQQHSNEQRKFELSCKKYGRCN